MRSGNLHLLLLTRDNENQPLLIAVREQAALQNKRPAISNAHGYALTPALPASGVTHGSFQEAAYLLANRRSALPLSAPFSFIRLGCESVLLVQRGRLSVQSLQFGGCLRFPTRLPELLIAASLRSSDQASFFCRLRGEVKSFPFGRLFSTCLVV